MKTPTSAIHTLLCILLSLVSFAASTSNHHHNFLRCLSHHSNPSIPIYTPNTSSYTSILEFSIQNLRFSTPTTRKPQFILTPLNESQVQSAVICSRKNGLHLRIRSAGHDYEGLSYVSDVPFVLLDLINLASINVDARKGTAWVQSGATNGGLFYAISEASRNFGFPCGICPTVGIGGHFIGGGYGVLLRKYGLAADNIVDARIVNVHGKILTRKTMGEDLFWAIRGGGGGSFGVVISWKIKLVKVPDIVTVFKINRNLEQNVTKLVHKWQFFADKLPRELFIRIVFDNVNATQTHNKTIQASFQALFLGQSKKLTYIMEKNFPELGMKQGDCMEMSFVQSTLFFADYPPDGPIKNLLDRKPLLPVEYFKAKSEFVISETGLEGIWKMMLEATKPEVIFSPYGGRMTEISESAIPFPHRKGNIYMIQYLIYWDEEGERGSREHIDWIRRLYDYLAPYVSNSPRAAYINYRDLDLGQSKNGTASYSEARSWGCKYFKDNFDRLVKVKSKVDPGNFFRNEQSIPTWGLNQ